MEIVKANSSLAYNYELFDGARVPTGAIESIKRISEKYLRTEIYDKNLYIYDNKREQTVRDLNTGEVMELQDYIKKYRTYQYADITAYCKAIIEDDILCLLLSDFVKIDGSLKLAVVTIEFIFRNKQVISATSYDQYGIDEKPQRKPCFVNFPLYSLGFILNGDICGFFDNDKHDMMKQISNYFGVCLINGSPHNLMVGDNAYKFFEESEPKAPTKFEKAYSNYLLNNIVTNYKYGDKPVTFEEYKDMLVMRFFKEFRDKVYEPFRVFITNDGVFCFKQSCANGFVQMKKSNPKALDYWTLTFDDIPDNEMIKYVKAMFKNKKFKPTEFLTCLSSNVLEQFRKSGLENAANKICGICVSHSCKPETAVELVFGKLGPNKGLKKLLGLNQSQIEWLKLSYLNGYDRYNSNIEMRLPQIRAIKYILGVDSLAPIDDKTFSDITLMMDLIIPWNYQRLSKYDKWTTKVYLMKSLMQYYNDAQKMVSVYKQLAEWRYICDEHYLYDIFRMALLCRDVGIFSGNPIKGITNDNFREMIPRLHDNLTILYNSYTTKLRDKCYADNAFEKLYKKWEKYEFEDDDYAVIAPKTPTEIIEEGVNLHHCVKTFVPRVYEGRTTIYFIRRKADRKSSFFTAEVDDKNSLRQVHGLCNCNITNEQKGLKEFINKWTQEKKIKEGEYNKVLAAR